MLDELETFTHYGPSPNHSVVQPFFASAGPTLLGLSSAVDNLQLAPYGIVAAVFPLVSLMQNNTQLLSAGGLNLFTDSSSAAAAALAVQSRSINVNGPLVLTSARPSSCDGSATSACPSADAWASLSLVALLPMFVADAGAGFSNAFQWPGIGVIPSAPSQCDALTNKTTLLSLCAANATGDGKRFWGFTQTFISWSNLITLANFSKVGDTHGAATQGVPPCSPRAPHMPTRFSYSSRRRTL